MLERDVPAHHYSIEPKIEHVDSKRFQELKHELSRIYAAIFREAPYFEAFTEEEAEQILTKFVQHRRSVLCVAHVDGEIAGFTCGCPLGLKDDVFAIFATMHHPKSIYYHAEVAVLDEYRRYGIASLLLEEAFRILPKMGYSGILMRTSAKIENVASRRLHHKFGFEEIPKIVQNVEMERVDGTRSPDPRIFLYRELA